MKKQHSPHIIHRSNRKEYGKNCTLILQGGGALGSYQAGVYEALSVSQYLPDWVAGISIGAINAALIAGNAPVDRVSALRTFWQRITAPGSWFAQTWLQRWQQCLPGGAAVQQQVAGAYALMAGQPGFFTPRSLWEWMQPTGQTSAYDTTSLRETLIQLVDFERINDPRETRLSLGAVNVHTGQFAYFDSAKIPLRVEHVMASGALPPGFPPIEIDGEFFWDGGLVSNTPLQYVMDYMPRASQLAFQVDVFHGLGPVPKTLAQVSEREKDIRYSSRTRINTEAFAKKHEVRHAINELFKRLPPEIARTEQAKTLYAHGCVTEMDIVQLIYRPDAPQSAQKDYEFSRATMTARWRQGQIDGEITLAAAPWLVPKPAAVGVRVFDVIHDARMARYS